jgi:predicted nucleotidyltransferase
VDVLVAMAPGASPSIEEWQEMEEELESLFGRASTWSSGGTS